MLETGLTTQLERFVGENDTARVRGSGSLDVFATPALAELVEACCCACIEGKLEAGETSVGSRLDLQHVAPTPVGMRVTCTCELVEIDGRVLSFDVQASDECGLIGQAHHTRAVVQAERFQSKTDAKGQVVS
ncbi:MAG: thioesterase family protein [Atopobiaceae bacterium]|nr:thioesterase family protein [Atopobiaceae bacterium]